MEFTQGTKESAAHFSLALDSHVELTAGLWGTKAVPRKGKCLVAEVCGVGSPKWGICSSVKLRLRQGKKRLWFMHSADCPWGPQSG